jgi:hypothetical protein
MARILKAVFHYDYFVHAGIARLKRAYVRPLSPISNYFPLRAWRNALGKQKQYGGRKWEKTS